MLGSVWETPVSSLNVTGIASVSTAVRILDDTIRSVQSRGWAFNTEHEYPLAADVDGFIPLPSNTLNVDPDGTSGSIDGVQRGSRLYDRGEHTFVFTVSPVYVKIILGIDYDDTPETFKQYVSMLAARRFKAEHLSQPEGDATSAEIEALRNLQEAEGDTGDHNVLKDNWSVARILRR
jgi:hypothetical protein